MKPIHPPSQELKELTAVGPEVPHREQSPSELPMPHRAKQKLSTPGWKCVQHLNANPTLYKVTALANKKFLEQSVLAWLWKGQGVVIWKAEWAPGQLEDGAVLQATGLHCLGLEPYLFPLKT